MQRAGAALLSRSADAGLAPAWGRSRSLGVDWYEENSEIWGSVRV